MSPPDDLFLVTSVLLFNDKRAFDKLVKRYQGSIRRLFLHLTLGNQELCNDLSQETFIKAYLHLISFKGTARFSTWLYRISYNVYYDFLKKTNREVTLDSFELPEDVSYSDMTSSIHLKLDLYESLKILREVEKTAVLLFYMEDMTHEKIAFIMNCPVGTVKSYILRGKEKMASYFKNSGYEGSI